MKNFTAPEDLDCPTIRYSRRFDEEDQAPTVVNEMPEQDEHDFDRLCFVLETEARTLSEP